MRALDRPPSTGIPGAVSASCREDRVGGEANTGSGTAARRAGAVEVGQALDAAVVDLPASAWKVSARAAVERGRPHGDRGAVLDLAALREHAAGAAAHDLRRAAAPRATPSSVASGRREMGARGEHDGQVGTARRPARARRGRRLDCADPSVGLGRQRRRRCVRAMRRTILRA